MGSVGSVRSMGRNFPLPLSTLPSLSPLSPLSPLVLTDNFNVDQLMTHIY